MKSELKARRWKASDAERVLDEVERSGLADGAFAAKHGVHPKRLWQWRVRLGRSRSGVAAGERPGAKLKLSESEPAPELSTSTPQFVEVSASRPTALSTRTAEIRLRNGRAVVVAADVELETIGALLDLVEARG